MGNFGDFSACEICVSVLSDAFPKIPVSTEVPQQRPKGRFILLTQTACSIKDFLAKAQMTIAVWGESDADAYALAIDVMHALNETAGLPGNLSDVEMINMARDEWAATGQARWMLQVLLTINTD